MPPRSDCRASPIQHCFSKRPGVCKIEPGRAAVVEDALVGVEAGRRGQFGLVVGVDRDGYAEALIEHGADIVVADLADIHVDEHGSWTVSPADHRGPGEVSIVTPWLLTYDGFDPDEEGQREVLCALGNGYFASRSTAPEAVADGVHYPGTYVAGVYNRLVTEMAGRPVENESLVNVPNWLPLTFGPAGGHRFGDDGHGDPGPSTGARHAPRQS